VEFISARSCPGNADAGLGPVSLPATWQPRLDTAAQVLVAACWLALVNPSPVGWVAWEEQQLEEQE